MREDGKIDYLELPAPALASMKSFYAEAFGWRFVDYGPGYAGFEEGLDGGLDGQPFEDARAPLPVIYAVDLEAMFAKVEGAGATIVRPIYGFPGGRRFHFRDPAGNELAVWSPS